jgi:hypothetical protein
MAIGIAILFGMDETQPTGGMELSMAQRFELERHGRLLDELEDIETLRSMAKLLLRSWYAQKAATAWVMRQGLAR